jgi:hypothetical protein
VGVGVVDLVLLNAIVGTGARVVVVVVVVVVGW